MTFSDKRQRAVEIAVAVLIGAGFFLLLQASPDIPGGTDGYRHAKQAFRLIHEPKAMFADPWHLAYLWPRPVDPWFGFHALLAPFVYFFGLINGLKLVCSEIFGAIAYVMFLLLRRVGVENRVFWVLLTMIGSSMTLGRATTVRPFLLSLLLTLLAALFTLEDKPLKLALVSFIHALSYSIFFIVGMAPGLWFLLRRDRRSGIGLLSCGAGMTLGLVANPYFPENVRFDVVQASVVSIARAAHVKIAGELAAAGSWWVVAALLPAALPFLGAVIARVFKKHAAPEANLFLLISIATLVGTVKVLRTADFFIPFSVLFASMILAPYIAKWGGDARVAACLLLAPCAINIWMAHAYVVTSYSLKRFQGAADYLKTNAPEALVANVGWAPDYFFLFFYNSESRYVIGIEPTFLFLTDPHKYWTWRHMNDDDPFTCGEEVCAERMDVARAAREELGAEYLVNDHDTNPRLDTVLRSDPAVSEVYRDGGLSVYRIGHVGETAAAAR